MEAKISAKNRERVDQVKQYLDGAKSIVLVNYQGLTVNEDTALRKLLRENNVTYFVCKNTLLRIAAHDLGIEGLDEYLTGATAVAVSKEDEVITAKVVAEYAKKLADEKECLDLKAGIIDSVLMDTGELKRIINLPSKQVLLAKLLGSLNAPISGTVMTLSGILKKLVYAIDQIREQKEN